MEKRKKILSAAFTILMTLIGTFIMAIGNMAFLRVYDIVTGGFTGIAIILNASIIKFISPGVISIILNIPLFIYAYKLLGMKYIQLAIVGTLCYSVFIDVIPLIGFDFMALTNDEPLLATIYGGVICGVGYGIVVKIGASTGGSNTLADIIKIKLPTISFGTILLVIDALVILLSAIVFGIDKALYAFIVIFLSSRVTDYILDGKKSTKVFYIVSSEPEKLANAIFTRVGRGVTALKGRGQFTGTDKEVLLCVILRSQTNELKAVIYDIDPNAFVFCQNATEVYGDGFVKLTKSKSKKPPKNIIIADAQIDNINDENIIVSDSDLENKIQDKK